jgi:uncharacterized repeat protein (TIGR01451 family)
MLRRRSVSTRPSFLLTFSFILLLALLPDCSPGQAPPPLPERGPAPLLYVRFAGPEGMHVTVYQGAPPGHDYAAPLVVGLRPGYLHRVRLSGLPGRPAVTLAPTLEVLGTLHLTAHLCPEKYPAPVVLTEQDIERVLAGALVTKVIYLENPDRAVAAATRPDQPLELELPPTRDLVNESWGLGRPMLLLRLGQRDVGIEELAAQSIPSTVLLPGDKVLPPARVPPYLPWACVPVYDPLAGPRPPEEECLHDGGDAGPPAGIDAQGRLRGLDPSDTIAEYTDCHGRRHLACSNRVCICVPRYAVLRTELPPAGYVATVGPVAAQAVRQQGQLRLEQPSRETHQNEQPNAMKGRLQPSAAFSSQGVARLDRLEVLNASLIDIGPAALLGTKEVVRLTEVERTSLARQLELARQFSTSKRTGAMEQAEGPAVVGRVEGLAAVSSVAETRDITLCCNEAPHVPEKPLHLCKWASAHSAQVGDVITFYLKYSNHGGQPITDIAVSDSLAARLEYIPGTARADRDAVFTTQQNEAGSVILRWEIGGRLLPGQSGVVSFQARVR